MSTQKSEWLILKSQNGFFQFEQCSFTKIWEMTLVVIFHNARDEHGPTVSCRSLDDDIMLQENLNDLLSIRSRSKSLT